jgi:multidrug resistance efflux pump
VSKDFLTFPVQRGQFKVSVESDGVIVDKDETVIKPPVLGWIWEFTILDIVADGAEVDKNDVLVIFDDSQVEKERINAMTALENQKAEYNKLIARQEDLQTRLEADLEKARLDLKLKQNQMKSIRFEAKIKQEQLKLEHYKVELRVEDLTKRLKLQAKIAEEERKSQKLRIKQAEIRVNRAEEHLKKLILKAPKDGTAILKESWRGKPEKGKTVGIWEPLMGITSMQDLQVECQINEIDIKKVKEGMPARIELYSAPGTVFECEVSEVAKLAKEDRKSAGIKKFQVYIDVKDENPLIRPGYSARVTILSKTVEDTLYIPLESVFPIPEDEKEKEQDREGTPSVMKTDTDMTETDSDGPGDEPGDTTGDEREDDQSSDDDVEVEKETEDDTSGAEITEKEMVAFVFENGHPKKKFITVGIENDNFIQVLSGLKEGDNVTLRDPEKSLRKLGEENQKDSPGTPGKRDATP